MSYSQMVKLLRDSSKGKIVFVNAGVFYIAIEEDAVLLNSKLQLKCSCFQKNTCKVGVPIETIDKYLKEIEKLGYGYIVYRIDKKRQELSIVREFEGRKKNKTERKNINCLLCKGVSAYPDDDYLEALYKFSTKKREEFYREYEERHSK